MRLKKEIVDKVRGEFLLDLRGSARDGVVRSSKFDLGNGVVVTYEVSVERREEEEKVDG